MPINFPTSLDTFTNPDPTSPITGATSLSTEISNSYDGIEALEAKVGTGASTPVQAAVFLANGTGTTKYIRTGRFPLEAFGSVTAADNTTTLQTAIDTISAIETETDTSTGNDGETVHGGELLLPTNLLWASALTMASNVTITGPAHTHARTGSNKGAYVARIKQLAGNNGPLITVPKGVIGYGFRNLSLDGYRSQQTFATGHDGIHIEEVQQASWAANVATLYAPFTDLVVENFHGTGINCSAVHIAPKIRDVVVRYCATGIRMGCTDWRIRDTNIVTCTTYGLWAALGYGRISAVDIYTGAVGIYIAQDPAFGYGIPTRLSAWGCNISSNTNEAVKIGAGVSRTSWSGCHFYNNSTAGAGSYSHIQIDTTSSTHGFDEGCEWGDSDNKVAYDINISTSATVRDAGMHTGGYVTAITNAPGQIRGDVLEGTSSPTLTFDTPGDLSVTYSRNNLRWTKRGKMVTVFIDIATASFTYSTASGTLAIQSLPYNAANLSGTGDGVGACSMRGWTKANYTQAVLRGPAGGGPNMRVRVSGSGQTPADLTTAEIPSGSTVQIIGTLEYEIA